MRETALLEPCRAAPAFGPPPPAGEIGFLEGAAPAIGSHALRTGAAVFVLGMPELALGGLSEAWLLKACGHRHWLLLGEALGLAEPDFRDALGRKTYATFTAVAIRNARLDLARENDRLTLEGRIDRVSRTQFRSRQRARVRGGGCAEVEMISVFLRREIAGHNRSVVRGLPVAATDGAAAIVTDAAGLVGHSYTFRNRSWTEHLGFKREGSAVLRSFRTDPCPQADFNGADFLYFASFQSFVDRAEWAWFRQVRPLFATARREIFFHGNIDVGETVSVQLPGLRRTADALSHWCEIVRDTDGARLAEAITLRRLDQG